MDEREDVARRLAELEAELAEAEVATAQTPEELRDVSNEWLVPGCGSPRTFKRRSIHRTRVAHPRALARRRLGTLGVEADFHNQVLEQLESDVSRLEQFLLQATESSDVDLDRDGLQDVREQMREIRADVQEALADREDFEDRREDIAGDLADRVQDVREARYRLQWRHPETARR